MAKKNEDVSFTKVLPYTAAETTGLSLNLEELIRSAGLKFNSPDEDDEVGTVRMKYDLGKTFKFVMPEVDLGYTFLKQPKDLVVRKSELNDEVSALRKEI